MSARASSVLAVLALAIACAPEPAASTAEAASTPVAVAPATTPEAVTTPETARTREPAPAPEPPAATVTTPASPLRLVAIREGRVGLRRHRGAPLLLLEGEPVPLVGGAFTRRPGADAGLSTVHYAHAYEDYTLAFAGSLDEPNGAWLTTFGSVERVDSTYTTYRWTGTRWTRVEQREGLLLGHYAALVQREGAIFALQRWTVDEDAELSSMAEGRAHREAFEAKVRRALARATPSWRRVAGARASLPRIPEGMTVASAVADDRGTIFALARDAGTSRLDEPRVLLVWPPGERKADRVEVPGLDGAAVPRLFVNDEHILLAGGSPRDDGPVDPYLAIGEGTRWERVDVSLPGRDESGPFDVVGAARTSDGELWIALGHTARRVGWPLWRKPVGGAWQRVLLPSITAEAFGPERTWVRDDLDPDRDEHWVEVKRQPLEDETPRVDDLVWADGAVWVAGTIGGLAYEAYADDLQDLPLRSVVLTTRAGADPVATLPPTWQILLERRNRLAGDSKPGDDRCRELSLVIGPAELATSRPEMIAALEEMEAIDEDTSLVGAPYVAMRDGAEVLAIDGRTDAREGAEALRAAVAETAGVEPTLDCRIPLLLRSLGEPAPEPEPEPQDPLEDEDE